MRSAVPRVRHPSYAGTAGKVEHLGKPSSSSVASLQASVFTFVPGFTFVRKVEFSGSSYVIPSARSWQLSAGVKRGKILGACRDQERISPKGRRFGGNTARSTAAAESRVSYGSASWERVRTVEDLGNRFSAMDALLQASVFIVFPVIALARKVELLGQLIPRAAAGQCRHASCCLADRLVAAKGRGFGAAVNDLGRPNLSPCRLHKADRGKAERNSRAGSVAPGRRSAQTVEDLGRLTMSFAVSEVRELSRGRFTGKVEDLGNRFSEMDTYLQAFVFNYITEIPSA